MWTLLYNREVKTMKNITLAIDEETLTLGRKYAQKNNISFNMLVRKLINETVRMPQKNWLDDTFKLMDQANGNSGGKKWTREELYRG
ncbi:hypothetical protein LQZ21_13240 [Treponema sp. TIM-1]|uniref:hypothetical protein n=1 Tax=Treponema sp. TIM-1 TaxID=2898417 RepID=UPI0039815744